MACLWGYSYISAEVWLSLVTKGHLDSVNTGEVMGMQRPNVAKKRIGNGQVRRAKPSLLAQPLGVLCFLSRLCTHPRNPTDGSPSLKENCSHQNPGVYWKGTHPSSQEL